MCIYAWMRKREREILFLVLLVFIVSSDLSKILIFLYIFPIAFFFQKVSKTFNLIFEACHKSYIYLLSQLIFVFDSHYQ